GQALHQAQQELTRQHRQCRLPQPPQKPLRLHVGMDGTMIPLRDCWRRDGSAGALVCRSGERKVGVIYEARQREGRDAGVPRSASRARREGAQELGNRLAGSSTPPASTWRAAASTPRGCAGVARVPKPWSPCELLCSVLTRRTYGPTVPWLPNFALLLN